MFCVHRLNWLDRTLRGFVTAAAVFLILDVLNRSLAEPLHWVGVPIGVDRLLAGILVVWWFSKTVESKVSAHAEEIADWIVCLIVAFLGAFLMVASTTLVVGDWIPALAEWAGAPESVQAVFGIAALLLIVCGWVLLLRFLASRLTGRR